MELTKQEVQELTTRRYPSSRQRLEEWLRKADSVLKEVGK